MEKEEEKEGIPARPCVRTGRDPLLLIIMILFPETAAGAAAEPSEGSLVWMNFRMLFYKLERSSAKHTVYPGMQQAVRDGELVFGKNFPDEP